MAFGRSRNETSSNWHATRVSRRRPATRYGRGRVVTDALDEDIDALRAELRQLRALVEERLPAAE